MAPLHWTKLFAMSRTVNSSPSHMSHPRPHSATRPDDEWSVPTICDPERIESILLPTHEAEESRGAGGILTRSHPSQLSVLPTSLKDSKSIIGSIVALDS
jgi:hypothetical protein